MERIGRTIDGGSIICFRAVVSMMGAALIGGCASTRPVAERTTSPHRDYEARREAVEPVGEANGVYSRNPVVIGSPHDREYNVVTHQWERPWPFGPANSTSPTEW